MRPLMINGRRCCGACGKELAGGAGRCLACLSDAFGRPRHLYRRGDRVRLLVLAAGGWMGEGVVIRDQPIDDPTVAFRKDDPDEADPIGFVHWSELELVVVVAS